MTVTKTFQSNFSTRKLSALWLLGLWAGTGAAQGRPAAAGNQVTLSCAFSDGGSMRGDQTLALDYSRNRVNGIPANFSDAAISWDFVGSSGQKIHHRLSRLSGFITISTDELPSAFTGHCTPGKKQF